MFFVKVFFFVAYSFWGEQIRKIYRKKSSKSQYLRRNQKQTKTKNKMLITTTNMGLQVDPIGLNNVNFMRYVRPVSVQRTRRCLFGRPDPDQNKRIYENAANNERSRCIERYGFDPVKSEFVVVENTNENKEVDDKNERENSEPTTTTTTTVSIDKSVQCLEKCSSVDKQQSADIVRDDAIKDVIKGCRTQKRPHESRTKGRCPGDMGLSFFK